MTDWSFQPKQRKVTLMNWYLDAWKNYFTFSGRSRRTAYWMFVLFNIIAIILANIIDNVLGLAGPGGYGPISAIYGLAVFIPGLALAIRRLHDAGRTGWWMLIGFVPVIGLIVLIIFFVTDSQPGSNQYGPNPKEA
jgi:uncharacterized membrane protein YhaH (DUF805 family)